MHLASGQHTLNVVSCPVNPHVCCCDSYRQISSEIITMSPKCRTRSVAVSNRSRGKATAW